METILLLVIIGLLIFISYSVNNITSYLKREATAYVESVTVDDDDYVSAKEYVIETGKASTSSLQSAFRWGYNKAARIIGKLEEEAIIGPAEQGLRYRKILIKENK